MSQTRVAHTKPLSQECKVCQGHAEGSKVTKHSFSNSAKRYYCDLADSVLEPSLIKSALVYQYLYKKCILDPILIFKKVFTLACVAGGILVFLGLVPGQSIFFLLLPHLLHHFSNGPSLRHIACDIKHCEMNNGQSVDMNIVFAS